MKRRTDMVKLSGACSALPGGMEIRQIDNSHRLMQSGKNRQDHYAGLPGPFHSPHGEKRARSQRFREPDPFFKFLRNSSY
ncbi:MAG: hypothetical protein ACKO5E_10135, partial [bacterium]